MRRVASKVPYALRPAYLEALAVMLQALPETGPGAVRRAARALAAKFYPHVWGADAILRRHGDSAGAAGAFSGWGGYLPQTER
jgi:hypothetical protein